MENKLSKLKQCLMQFEGAVLAFSGGVDSTYLLKIAQETLNNQILAVIGKSETFPKQEFKMAVELAKTFKVPYLVIETDEMSNPAFVNNSPNRCYYCKKELFTRLNKIAAENGFAYVLDGSNADDENDFRPGMRAAKELSIRSPLKEVGLTKSEIRTLSKQANLPTWDKPSMACLSSRFPYGDIITKDKLTQVNQAEDYLRTKGLKQVRVRIHGYVARIEVERDDIPLILKATFMEDINNKLKSYGFKYVALDLGGFKSGNMNATRFQEV